MDNSINEYDVQQRGKDRYYICYEQQYMNDNQFGFLTNQNPHGNQVQQYLTPYWEQW